jgi:hypothetical protein
MAARPRRLHQIIFLLWTVPCRVSRGINVVVPQRTFVSFENVVLVELI